MTERRNFFFSFPTGEKKTREPPQEIFRIRVLKSPLAGALLQQCLPPFWRVERTRGGATDCGERKEEPDFFFVRMGGKRMKRKEEEEE